MSEKDWEPIPQPEIQPEQKQAELYIDDVPPPEKQIPANRPAYDMGEGVKGTDATMEDIGGYADEDQEDDAA